MHSLAFTVKDDGTLVMVYHPNDHTAQEAIGSLGTLLSDRRVGHVWPRRRLVRWAFRTLRRIFGGDGWVAECTRNWGGKWIVVLADSGKRLPGVYASHDAAVTAEVEWSLRT